MGSLACDKELARQTWMKRCSSSTFSCAVRPCAASEMISKPHSPVASRKSMPITVWQTAGRT